MRKIKFIVVHCTAGHQNSTVKGILKYWKEDLRWKTVGYHYLITDSGKIVNLLTEDKNSNGVKGYNDESINVCYIGGVDEDLKPIDNRTETQKEALIDILTTLKEKYPRAVIKGHRDFSPDIDGSGVIERDEWIKDCPCFDARTEYQQI